MIHLKKIWFIWKKYTMCPWFIWKKSDLCLCDSCEFMWIDEIHMNRFIWSVSMWIDEIHVNRFSMNRFPINRFSHVFLMCSRRWIPTPILQECQVLLTVWGQVPMHSQGSAHDRHEWLLWSWSRQRLQSYTLIRRGTATTVIMHTMTWHFEAIRVAPPLHLHACLTTTRVYFAGFGCIAR